MIVIVIKVEKSQKKIFLLMQNDGECYFSWHIDKIKDYLQDIVWVEVIVWRFQVEEKEMFF